MTVALLFFMRVSWVSVPCVMKFCCVEKRELFALEFNVMRGILGRQNA